jgi:UDP-N-acetylmuramate--alanine ligase
MHIYFSGIGGVGLGPLAELARDAGYEVSGSDTSASLMTDQLQASGVTISFEQSTEAITRLHQSAPIDWLVHTAAIDDHHPEIVFAKKHAIKVSKRDELLAHIITEKKLSLIAVSGTHGKTTTSGMMVWALQQATIPVSYSIGSQISFGPSGAYDPASQYFVYECDEFDRNFLYFSPTYSLITSYDYDHPDTYPTPQLYQEAFQQFINQSESTIAHEDDVSTMYGSTDPPPHIQPIRESEEFMSQCTLAGHHNRRNAQLVYILMKKIAPELSDEHIIDIVNKFPGTKRRFEKLADNIYSDYAHHPVEIEATIQLAREINPRVAVVYQPHQNIRQQHLKDQYQTCFKDASQVYWLPTYLSRESADETHILSPRDLTAFITHPLVILSELDEKLFDAIESLRAQNILVICMGAGSIDEWVRQRFTSSSNS